jgi:hypothetical protein
LNRFLYIITLLFIALPVLKGQDRYVQVSGIITDETNRVVPGVVVLSKNLRRGVLSEHSGIYSVISTPGDTIFFRALGYKRYHTVIPLNYTSRFASVDIRLEFDTIQIEGVNIIPWNTYDEFLRDITQKRPVNPIAQNMNRNIESIYVALQNETSMRISPEDSYRYIMAQNFNRTAYGGGAPNNLLNPFAWAKFIQGIKTGTLFRNNQSEKPKEAKVRKKINNAEKR